MLNVVMLSVVAPFLRQCRLKQPGGATVPVPVKITAPRHLVNIALLLLAILSTNAKLVSILVQENITL
jgi:hypothetical protein